MIYLARHGETTWNMIGRYQGRMESALSALGMRQGLALGEYFAQRMARGESLPGRIVSSPLLRCTATARFAATRLDLPVETDERLIEIAHGTWEGRMREEIRANDPERMWQWKNDPANVAFERGESVHDVAARWRDFTTTLDGSAGDVLVVSHDAVVRAALCLATDRSLGDLWAVRVENGAFAVLAIDRPQLSVVHECVTDHLRGIRAEIAGQAL